MPVTDHLAWAEIRDFSPGLWTASPHLMPASAAQQMDNCYPDPGGGLRAFWRTTPNGLTSTGLPATKIPRGFHVGYPVQQPADMRILTSNALLMMSDLANPAQGFNLYGLDRSVALGAAWASRKAFANGTPTSDLAAMSMFTGYRITGTGDVVAFAANLPPGGTTEEGIWWATLVGAGAPTQLTSAYRGHIVSHQSRLVIGLGSQLRWTNPGATAFDNSQDLAVGQPGAIISWIVPIAPSDLFVGMVGGQLYNIQGDLGGAYVVREMGRFQASGFTQRPVYTPYGIALIAGWDGVYMLSGGGQAEHISRGIAPGTWAPDTADAVSLGQPVFYRDMTFFPRGLVYDHLTKTWLHLPDLDDVMFLALDGTSGQEKVVGVAGSNPVLFPAVEFAGGVDRARDFTWKSAPLRDPAGREIEVREVQLVVQTYGGDETITVTVNGVPQEKTIVTAGRHAPRFLFRQRAAELDVTIRSQTDAGPEAPTIEAVRIGTRPGHLQTVGGSLESLNFGKWDVSKWDEAVWSA